MSSASDVSICSEALQRLGQQAISSFEENTAWAGLCASLYPTVRNQVLRSHPWNCATKRVILSPLAEPPAFDYAYQFQLPGDWLKTLQIGRQHDRPCYQIEGRRILSTRDVMPLVYIYLNENVGTWDDSLVMAVQLAMAAALAYPVTASTSLRESMAQEAFAALRSARTDDGQDSEPETFGDSPLLSARFGGH